MPEKDYLLVAWQALNQHAPPLGGTLLHLMVVTKWSKDGKIERPTVFGYVLYAGMSIGVGVMMQQLVIVGYAVLHDSQPNKIFLDGVRWLGAFIGYAGLMYIKDTIVKHTDSAVERYTGSSKKKQNNRRYRDYEDDNSEYDER